MIARIAGLVSAILFVVATCLPVSAIEGIEQRKERAKAEALEAVPLAGKALNEKNYDRAIELLTKVIDANVLSGEELGKIYYERGVAFQAKKDCVKALADYNHALETFTTSDVLYFNRSICHNEAKQPDEALSDLDHAIKIKPDAMNYRVARCIQLFNKKDFAGALPDCEMALKSAPDDKSVLLAISQAAEQTGNKARAAVAYKHLLELDPGNAVATAGLKRVGN